MSVALEVNGVLCAPAQPSRKRALGTLAGDCQTPPKRVLVAADQQENVCSEPHNPPPAPTTDRARACFAMPEHFPPERPASGVDGGCANGDDGEDDPEAAWSEDEGSAEDGGAWTEPSALRLWLAEQGLSKYSELFERASADLSLMPYLKDADLRQMGIAALGARKKLLLGAAELVEKRDQSDVAVAAGREQSSEQTLGFSGIAAGFGIASYFGPQRQQQPCSTSGSILQFLEGHRKQALQPAGLLLLASKTQASKGVQWVHKEAGGGSGRWGGRAATPHAFKSWQLVPGTLFVVDRFCNLPPTPPQQRHWFLTHFHADHYKGLTSKFDRGTIYCTPITAALVRQQLRVPAARLHEVAIGAAIDIDGVSVTFLDANHCPGAAMLLFQAPGRRPVLHTGDCRLTAAMQEMPQLQQLRGTVDLVLDTTYCDPQYNFPAQQEVLEFAIDAVKAEAFNPKTLFWFGSYTIGKERLYLEAARVLGRKIYVSATKKKVLDCLQLPAEVAALLTTDDSETNLHAVPLWMVTQKHMAKVLRFYRGRFSSVVGFQPTGWTHEKASSASRKGRRRQKGALITYQVPYSEHSSFTELAEFVKWLQPRSILPHVNNDGGGPKAQRMVALLRGHA